VRTNFNTNRRDFMIRAATLSVVMPTLDACASFGNEQDTPLPSGFGPHSTAAEVTAGIDLGGKTALITGCDAGTGYETLRVLTLRGAHVYALSRTLEKAEAACASVTGPGVKGDATPFACEHTDFASIEACADSIRKLGSTIDILICNAGVYGLPKLELVDGIEKHFVINHLAHFILVNRLLDPVKAARQGRIVIVGSDAAFKQAPDAGIEFDNLSGQHSYTPSKAYGQSKLANGLFALELARRLSRTGTIANVVHPGWVMTDRMHSFLLENQVNPEAAEKVIKTPSQGAATICYVATNGAVQKANGQYFEDCNVAIPGGHMRDTAMASRLWAVSEDLTRDYLIQAAH